MDEEEELLKEIEDARESFGAKCGKYVGAVTVQVLKRALGRHGIETSARDVFIQGLPVEIDLLIAREGATPENEILYRPEDVIIAFEVKSHGAYGETALESIANNFEKIQAAGSHIRCLYVNVMERRRYKWAATSANLGYSVYTLFWYKGSGITLTCDSSGDWQRLQADIEAARHSASSPGDG